LHGREGKYEPVLRNIAQIGAVRPITVLTCLAIGLVTGTVFLKVSERPSHELLSKIEVFRPSLLVYICKGMSPDWVNEVFEVEVYALPFCVMPSLSRVRTDFLFTLVLATFSTAKHYPMLQISRLGFAG
jgi:hypothetical protein